MITRRYLLRMLIGAVTMVAAGARAISARSFNHGEISPELKIGRANIDQESRKVAPREWYIARVPDVDVDEILSRTMDTPLERAFVKTYERRYNAELRATNSAFTKAFSDLTPPSRRMTVADIRKAKAALKI